MRSASLVGRPDFTERTITSMALANSLVNFLLRRLVRKPSTQRGRPKLDGEHRHRHDDQRRLAGDEADQRRRPRPARPQTIQKVRARGVGKARLLQPAAQGGLFLLALRAWFFSMSLSRAATFLRFWRRFGLRLDARGRWPCGLATALTRFCERSSPPAKANASAAQREHRQQIATTIDH